MKILMQSRYDILTKRGGDTVQMEQTKKALEVLGVIVDVNCSPDVTLKDYDVVHLFNLDWIQETYRQAKNAKSQNKPYVLSPIHHRLRDIRIWEDTDLYDFKRLIYPLFKSYSSREFLKGLYKAILSWDYSFSTLGGRKLVMFITQRLRRSRSDQRGFGFVRL